MSIPVAPTPILEGEAADKFFKQIEENLKTPSRLIETPNLGKVEALLREHARKKKEGKV
jgi:hypothetical protein